MATIIKSMSFRVTAHMRRARFFLRAMAFLAAIGVPVSHTWAVKVALWLGAPRLTPIDDAPRTHA